MANKLLKKIIDFCHIPYWLFFVLILILVLRIPSFFEPFSYGDEMIYLTLGNAARKSLVFYKDIHDNKPPFLYWLAGVSGNVFFFRAILAFWMLFTTVLFWRFVKKLEPKNKLFQKIAVFVFAILTTIPLLEGQIANAELFMLMPTIIGFSILLEKMPNLKQIFIAGSMFGLATLFKVPAAFDLGAVILFWLVLIKKPKQVKGVAINTLILAVGFALPIIASLVWYYLQGSFSQYLAAAFLQNIGYLSSWRPNDVAEPFLTKNGPLLIRACVVLVGFIIIWIKRKSLDKTLILSSLWALTSLFAVTLSERPYPHYLIQIVPALSLLLAFLFAFPKKQQVLALIPITLIFTVPVIYKFWYYPSFPYYERFILFATNRISKEEYFNRFDSSVNRNYKIAEFIKRSAYPDDKIFVWGSTGSVYALSRRLPSIKYTTNYHISDFYSREALMREVSKRPPAFIIIQPNSDNFPELQDFLNTYYFLINTLDNATIWRLR